MPNVSIIMPVYNKANYLAKTFNALISQSYQDWEMIVVNDGSTDGCTDIIEKYVERDSRICCVKQNNKGVSAARNAGLSIASGEWIWFVDADDLPNQEFLQDVFSDEQDDTIDIIVGNYQRLEINGEILDVFVEEQGLILVENFPDLFMKYQYKTGYWGYLWNKLIRRKFLQKKQINFQEGLTLAEDLKFMVELYRENTYIYIVPYMAMRYTADAINASKEKRIDYMAQLSIQIEIKEWIVDSCKKLEYVNYFKWIISRYAAYVVYYAKENNEDYISLAKMLGRTEQVNSQLSLKNIESIMKPIVWCLIRKKYSILRMYLLTRKNIRNIYRKMRH